METPLIPALLAVLCLALLGALIWALRRPAPADPAAGAERAELAARLDEAQKARAKLEAEAEGNRARTEQALEQRAAVQTKLVEVSRELAEAKAARQKAEAGFESERDARVKAEKAADLASQKLVDFEQIKAQMTEAAKAATLESGKQLTGQLLETHKREAEAQKKEGEDAVRKTTEALYQRFAEVSNSVTALNAQVNQTALTVNTVHRALSNPGGAGRMAEIGLENLLKSFGLEPGRDFIVQYHAAGDADRGALRPDAVVFLPGDAALVIDSKASKALLEHAEAETESDADAALARLAQRMNQHLRALEAKDYGRAVLDTYKSLNRGGSLKRSVIAMALPNEAAVEKLRRADAGFEQRATLKDIVIAGPSALAAVIAVARMEIDAGRQVENLDRIMEAVAKLIESFGPALALAEKAGRGLQTAADNFEKFSRSVNARVLPRIRGLAPLGIRPGKNLPDALPSFEVKVGQSDGIIEGEAEEVMPPQLGKPE